MKDREKEILFGKAILAGLKLVKREVQSAFLVKRDDKICGCASGIGLVGLIGNAGEAYRRYTEKERPLNMTPISAMADLTDMDYKILDAISDAHCHGVPARKIARRLIKGEPLVTYNVKDNEWL